MNSIRNKDIAAKFGANAEQYDENAGLQARVAAELASCLPARKSPKVLEIGCGTGLFSEHLLAHYPDGQFYFTDLSEEMLKTCKQRIANLTNTHFICCDGENLSDLSETNFDIITTSMTAQWFSNPITTLEYMVNYLKPGGELHYSTIGNNCFPEWCNALDNFGYPSAILKTHELPGIFKEQNIEIHYSDAMNFLQTIKNIGASTPEKNYTPLTAGQLRKILRYLDEQKVDRYTWHIIYGKLVS